MPTATVDLLRGRAAAEPALELAVSLALLNEVAAGNRGPLLRSYRPAPAVAFGRRDRFLAGFGRAAAAAERHGFTPVIRSAGGRAAAYDEGCLVLDEIVGEADSSASIRERFADRAELHAAALRRLGVDARVGELAGEYCPGEFSVNARGRTKLIGSAQRIVRGGWLFSTVVVVESGDRIRGVLEPVYAALGLNWDPETAGSVADEAPGVAVADVERAMLGAYRERQTVVDGSLGEPELAAARELVARHRVEGHTLQSGPDVGR